MPHEDYAVFAAIGAIGFLTGLALFLGQSDGLLATAITVLAGLGGFRLVGGMIRGKDNSGAGGGSG